tara:strand:+ start:7598 stop:9958 length:2361 start_codon:yes stop_codon:yes gene_type:complete
MADRYPTYQRRGRLSAQIVTPPNVDQAALREQARGYGNVAQAANRVVDFALKEGSRQAAIKGTSAGAADPEGTLQTYKDDAPFTSYEIAAYNAAVKASSAQIQSDARLKINNALIKATHNRTDPTVFRGEIDAIAQGSAEAIALLDPETAAATQLNISGFADTAFLKLSESDLQREQAELKAKWVPSLDTYRDQIEQISRDQGDISEVLKAARENALGLGVSPATLEKDILALQSVGRIARVNGAFEASEDKEAFLSEFNKNVKDGDKLAKGLNEKEIKSLRSGMSAVINGEKAEYKRRVSAASSDITEQGKILANGDDVSPKALGDIKTAVEELGDPDLSKEFALLDAQVDVARKMDKQPLSVQLATVRALRANAGEDITYEESQLIEFSEKRFKSNRTKYTTDLVGNGLLDGEDLGPVLVTPKDAGAWVQGGNLDQRIAAVQRYATQKGVTNTQILSNDEVRQWTNIITSGETKPADKLAVIKGVIQSAKLNGMNVNDVWGAMVEGDKDAPIWIDVGRNLSATGNARFAFDVLEGLAAKQEGATLDKLPHVNVEGLQADRAKIHKELIDTGVQPANMGSLMNQAELATLARLAKNTSLNFADTYKQALAEAMGQHTEKTTTGNVETFGGSYEMFSLDENNVILAPDMSHTNAGELRRNFTSLDAETIARIGSLSGLEGPPRTLTKGTLSKSDIDGIIFQGAGIAGRVILKSPAGDKFIDKNGNDYIIDLKDAWEITRDYVQGEAAIKEVTGEGRKTQSKQERNTLDRISSGTSTRYKNPLGDDE